MGEIVFTTSMSGYQESMTDPSYAGQLITFTFPQIGNYGVSAEAMESDRVHARAAIMRAAVDREDARRRRLAHLADRLRHPGDHRRGHPGAGPPHPRPGRDAGRRLPGRLSRAEARELIEAEPEMTGRDLAREVTPGER